MSAYVFANTRAHRITTYIILGQKVERTEDLVILKLKTLRCFEVPHIRIVLWILRNGFGTPLGFELLLTVGVLCRRDARTSAGSTVVVVGVGRMR